MKRIRTMSVSAELKKVKPFAKETPQIAIGMSAVYGGHTFIIALLQSKDIAERRIEKFYQKHKNYDVGIMKYRRQIDAEY